MAVRPVTESACSTEMLELEQKVQPLMQLGKGFFFVRGSKHRNLGSGASLDKVPGHSAGDRQAERGCGTDVTQWWTHELSYSSLASNDEGYTQQVLPCPLASVWTLATRPCTMTHRTSLAHALLLQPWPLNESSSYCITMCCSSSVASLCAVRCPHLSPLPSPVPQPWLPDEISSHCMLCERPFHLMRWTHHCRDCGGLFCHAYFTLSSNI